MAATDSTQHSDFEDFYRYYHGEMSFEEQHKFEKRMLDEPLVADAYEGFVAMLDDKIHFDAVKKDLSAQLHARISEKRKNIIPLWAYGAAASVIIVIGVFWQTNTGPAVLETAKVAVNESPVTPPAITEIKPSVTPVPNTALAKPLPGQYKKPASSEAQTPDFHHSEKIAVVSEEMDAGSLSDSEALTDNSPDTSIDFRSQSLKLDSIRVALASPKKNMVFAENVSVHPSPKASSARAGGLIARNKLPMPLGGWESYRKYLDTKTKDSEFKGTVTVSFVVGSDGSLSEFLPKGDQPLHDQAIRILKEGPAWLPAVSNGERIGNTAEVTIRFGSGN